MRYAMCNSKLYGRKVDLSTRAKKLNYGVLFVLGKGGEICKEPSSRPSNATEAQSSRWPQPSNNSIAITVESGLCRK